MLTVNSLHILMIIICFIITKPTPAVSYNQPKFCPSAAWNLKATTFANQSIVGSQPAGIFVNSNNTIYVANREKGGVVVWFNNSIKPTRTILNASSSPFSIFVTINSDIYLDNGNPNHRVDKWMSNTNTSIPVMYVNSSCDGLFVDINDTLYCSMRNHHQVIKRWLNDEATAFTVVAGRGKAGSTSTTLYNLMESFINFDLYVADGGNNRIQLFQSGQLNGSTVAGTGSSNTTITLNCPTGIVLDADKYLFIVDSYNHRIVGSDLNGCRCIVGCSDSFGSASDELYHPRSLNFDSFGNIFVTDPDNDRIQKFLLSTNSCVTSSTTMTASNLEKNVTAMSNEPKTTSAITTVKASSTISFTDSTSTTSSLTPTTTETISVTTTTSYKLSSNNIVPTPCKNSTRMGLYCNISSTTCDMFEPCQNNGTCYNNDIEPLRYVCLCPSDFNGTQCQFDRRPCKQNTCWHDGICNETSNTTFICQCQNGWQGIHCEIMDNYCENIKCENNGVCRPLFRNYTCECLGESFSGRHCEITATKIKIYRIVSKSFAYVAIIAMISFAMFIVIMDILKYCFGIDPVQEERERIRRKKQVKNRKPIIQRFVYVNPPAPSPSEQLITIIEETAV